VFEPATIQLSCRMKSKRNQYLLTPASVSTKRKSWTGSYKEVVYQCDMKQCNQLVYVAPSRVESTEGIYILNTMEDHTFHHKNRGSSPFIIKIRGELNKLENHGLDTLTNTVESFCRIGLADDATILCTATIQSLPLHINDLRTNSLVMRSDVLALTETWVDDPSEYRFEGFCLATASHTSLNSSSIRRTGGQTGIYVKERLMMACCVLPTRANAVGGSNRLAKIGDIVKISISDGLPNPLILIAVYLHPGSTKEDIRSCLAMHLTDFHHTLSLVSNRQVVTVYFNIDARTYDWTFGFMEDSFSFACTKNERQTTSGGGIIDLMFTGGVRAECMPYVFTRAIIVRDSVECAKLLIG